MRVIAELFERDEEVRVLEAMRSHARPRPTTPPPTMTMSDSACCVIVGDDDAAAVARVRVADEKLERDGPAADCALLTTPYEQDRV